MKYEDNYVEELETPKDHTRRLAKITLYLDVPSDYDEFSLETAIEQKISELNIHTTGPSETMISAPGSDNPENFVNPVGFIAPDGKFYLVDGDTDGLAHLHLAPFVHDLYIEKGFNFRPFTDTLGLDHTLEKAGFVKVHGIDIRGIFHLPISNICSDKETVYSPDITDVQVKSIVRYGKLFNYEGDVFVNDKRVPLSKIAQADTFCLREIFEL